MKIDKQKLKEDFDKLLGITKDNAEKLWEGTLQLVDKGSKQYQILKLQKDIYFIQRKIDKLKFKLGEKVYNLYKKGKVENDDIKPNVFDIDVLLNDISVIETQIHKIKESETKSGSEKGKSKKKASSGRTGRGEKASPKKKGPSKRRKKVGEIEES